MQTSNALKRWTSFLLTLCLLMGFAPFSRAAEPEPDEAVAYVEDGKLFYGDDVYWTEDGILLKNGEPSEIDNILIRKIALMGDQVYVLSEEDESWIMVDDSLSSGQGNLQLLSSGNNEQAVFDFSVNTLGVNIAAACGILANIYAESSFNPNSSFIEADGRTSYGICQWNNGRLDTLKSFCNDRGLDYTTLDAQLQYLRYELNGSEKSAFNKVKSVENTADGAYTAGYNWAQYFERCATKYYAGRAEKARDVYWAKYGETKTRGKTFSSLNPIWPVGNSWPSTQSEVQASNMFISAMYRYYNNGSPSNHSTRTDNHNAFDIGASLNTKIYAVASGKIVEKKSLSTGFGNYIVIEHENGLYSLYGHLNKFGDYNLNDTVPREAVIGYCGSTGNSTGSHLHFEVYDPNNTASITDPWGSYYQGKIAMKIGGNCYKANKDYTGADSYAKAFCQWIRSDVVTGNSTDDYWFVPNPSVPKPILPEFHPTYKQNISTEPVQYNLSAGAFPSGLSEVEAGKEYYFNAAVSSDYSLSKMELYIKTAADSDFSCRWTDTPETGHSLIRWTNVSKRIGDAPGTLQYYWVFTSTDGRIFATATQSVTVKRANVKLNINGYLDGQEASTIDGYGLIDVYINGTCIQSNATGIYVDIPVGATYEIRNIRPADGCLFHGTRGASLTGTVSTENIDIRMIFRKGVNIGTGFYAYIINAASGNYLTNDSDSNITSRSAKGDSSQIWYFERLSNGRYKIVSAKDGKVMDLASGGTERDTNIWTYSDNGTLAQQWAIHGTENAYLFGSPCTEYVLDVHNGSLDGSNVSSWNDSGSIDQYFKIQKLGSITVTLNPSSGSVSPTSISVTYGGTYSNLPTPTRTGYTFEGWYTAASGGTQVTTSTKVTATSNHTLYARWIPIYWLDLNGYLDGAFEINTNDYGTFDVYINGSLVKDNTADYYDAWTSGTTYEIKDIRALDGYVYNGVEVGAIKGTIGSENIEVALSFSTKDKYTVTLDPNGGSVSPTSIKATYAETYSNLPTNPTRTGYTFNGWYTAKDGGTQVTTSTKVTATENHTLYAHWTQTVVPVTSVTLNKTALSLTAGDAETLAATVTPDNATNKAVTWATSDASVATVSGGKVTAVGAGTATVTASADGKSATCAVTVTKPVSTYTVTYSANGGSGAMPARIVVGNESLTLPVCSFTAPSGKQFRTWSTGGKEYAAGTVFNVTADTAFTAVWEDVPAVSGAVIEVGAAKGRPGRTVDVPLTLRGNPGLTALQLKLNYDENALALTEIADGGLLAGKNHGKNLAKNPYTLDWNDDTAEENNTDDGVVVTLRFTVAEDASEGSYPITVTLSEAWNADLEPVSLAVQSGSVTVTHTILGDVNGDGVVDGRDRMTLARYLADWDGYTIDEAAADVNEDGVVDGRDRMILARHLADWDGYETLPYRTN